MFSAVCQSKILFSALRSYLPISMQKGFNMKIITNPSWTKEEVDEFHASIKSNNGYCSCRIEHIPPINICVRNFVLSPLACATVVSISRRINHES